MILCLIILLLQPNTSTPAGDGYSCKTYGHIGKREILPLLNASCTDIYGHFWLLSDEISYEQAETAFSSVVHIYGCVSIRNTNFTDLAFFRNLQTITCVQNQVQAVVMKDAFVIENNLKLRSLGFKKIASIAGSGEAKHYVNGNHEALCLEPNERKVISTLPDVFVRDCAEPAACWEQISTKTDGSQIPANCSVIAWNIVLEGSINHNYLSRLEQVEVLLGNLTIRNNKDLKKLDISSLYLIRTSSIKEDYAIIIENSPKLNLVQLNRNLTIQGACKSVKIDRMTSPNVTFSSYQNENDCYNHEFD